MKALILAAGEGTRLRPYSLDRPKCLVEVDGVSLLDRQLSVLRSEGVADISLIGGYRSDMLKRPGLRLEMNPRYAETNMVWTLFSAEQALQGDLVLAYGDPCAILCQFAFALPTTTNWYVTVCARF